MNRSAIEAIVREVLQEELRRCGAPARHVDPSGVIQFDPALIQVEPFPFPIDTDRVKLVDVLSIDESPRVGCGVMEVDRAQLPWTLTYDEIDIVLEGTLDIIVDGRTTRATAGQVIYIPKNTSVVFSARDKARFVYVVYPANWSEQ
ncbi:MAG: cupin domain-containing protein [Propionibacteriaceae bacterium]|nr:cupin domain-containing protein [Propionibacteriaceae bacterium]